MTNDSDKYFNAEYARCLTNQKCEEEDSKILSSVYDSIRKAATDGNKQVTLSRRIPKTVAQFLRDKGFIVVDCEGEPVIGSLNNFTTIRWGVN